MTCKDCKSKKLYIFESGYNNPVYKRGVLKSYQETGWHPDMMISKLD